MYIYYALYLLLHIVIHEPSQMPNKKITNKIISRNGSLSQIIRKIIIAKCRTSVIKTNEVLNPNDNIFPLMKLLKELPSPNIMTA